MLYRMTAAAILLFAGPLLVAQDDDTNLDQDNGFSAETSNPMISISGVVVLPGGVPSVETVEIERTCNSVVTIEDYTDSKGRFAFQVGGVSPAPERSITSSAGGSGPQFGNMRSDGGWGLRGMELQGCDLRAVLAGYRSPVIDLSSFSKESHIELGTIVLARPKGVSGDAVSATSYQAPKAARKAYEQGFRAAHNRKPKLEQAVKQFQKAVEIYPQYAAAWSALGEIHLAGNNLSEARIDLESSRKADPKFLKPLLPLLRLDTVEERWDEVMRVAAEAVKLHSGLTEAYLLAAGAALNLGLLDQAEQSADRAAQAKGSADFPQLLYLRAELAAARGKFGEAAEAIQRVLALTPNLPESRVLTAKAAAWRERAVQRSQ